MMNERVVGAFTRMCQEIVLISVKLPEIAWKKSFVFQRQKLYYVFDSAVVL
jgi:hypothetical protein